jgi:hypothetical protein
MVAKGGELEARAEHERCRSRQATHGGELGSRALGGIDAREAGDERLHETKSRRFEDSGSTVNVEPRS